MPVKPCLAALCLAAGTAFAAAIDCPPGAAPNGRETGAMTEAWCELAADRSLFHGPYRAWYPDGTLGTEENYVHGLAQGEARYRWGSGHKQAQGNYKDGVRDGRWRFWDKTGTPAGQVLYRQGVQVSGELPRWAADWDVRPAARHPAAQP